MLAWEAPVADEAEIGDRLGPYRLDRLLGQGGFGMVYLAQQLEPVRREVAIKLIKPGMDTRQVIARFGVEQQTLASLDHPGIARIFDAGVTPRGRPYFAMEYVPGETITTYCRTHRLSVREILRLVVRVCEGVQYAHQRGVIHRDLKPSNILVTSIDGVATPKIIDFGVAKAITDDSGADVTRQTVQGQILGTPEYMSPEQAELGPASVDTRSDVYSVGAVLYELLTGERPFDGKTLRKASTEELKRAIREVEPAKPSTKVMRTRGSTSKSEPRSHLGSRALSKRLKGDLDWITMRAMHKDRDRRYESASALAADIRRHATGRPVLAGPPSAWYRARKFMRRNRGAVSTAGLVALALLVGLVLFVGQYFEARSLSIELKETNSELGTANDDLTASNTKLKAREQELEVSNADLAEKKAELEVSNADLTEQRRQLALEKVASDAARDEAIRQERIAIANELVAIAEQRKAEHSAYAQEVSRAIEALLAGDLPVFVRSMEEAEDLGGGWEVGTFRAEFDQSLKEVPLAQFGASASAIMPDGRLILIGDDAGALRVVDPFAQRVEDSFGGGTGPVARIAVAYGAPRAATLSRTGHIQVWDLAQRRLLGEHRVLTDTPSAIALSAGGEWLAVGDAAGRVTIRDAASGDPIIARKIHETIVQTLAFSPDDLWLLSCSHDDDVARLSTSGWAVRKSDMRLDGIVRSIAFAGSGEGADIDRFFTGDESGAVVEWSIADHRPMRILQASGEPVLALAEDQGLVVGGTSDLGTRVWWYAPDAREQDAKSVASIGTRDEDAPEFLSRTLTGHESSVRGVAWVRGESLSLLTIDAGFVARIWQLGLTDPAAQTPPLHDAEIIAVVPTPDERILLTASADGSIREWDAETLLPYAQAPRLQLNGRAIAVGVSAEAAYALDATGALRRWDPLTGAVLSTRVFEGSLVRAMAVRPRDALVIMGDDAGTIHLLDGESLRTVREIDAHSGSINAIKISIDGRRAISVADDGEAIVWELERFTPFHHVGPFAHRPVSCAIDRTGQTIAVGDAAGFIHVHGVDSPDVAVPGLRRHDPRWDIGSGVGAPISALSFSPDGSRIVSADRAGVAVLWSRDFRQPIARLAGGEMAIGCVEFLGGDERLLAGRSDGRLRVWRSDVCQPRLEQMNLAERAPVNAAVIDAFCVSVSGERIVPMVGEPFSIGVQVRTAGLAGRLLELTRTVDGSRVTSRESAGTLDEGLRYAVSGAWVVDRPGIHEATISVRVLGDASDQVPSDDMLTIRFRAQER